MKKLLLSIAALTLAAGAFAQAPTTPAAGATAPAKMAQPAAEKGKRFQKIDTNKDGMISRAEAAGNPRLAKKFDAMDANKDGQLSKDELKAYKVAHKGEGKGKTTSTTPAAAPAVAPKS